jgi:hypothetical protein
MLTNLHEALIELLRSAPGLVEELLTRALQVSLPPHVSAEVADPSFAQIAPTEYRADAVVLFRDAAQTVVFAVVVEVQLRRDGDKQWTWPLYLMALRNRQRSPVALLVVTADESTADWASQPIALGHPGLELSPLVLRPSAVPRVTTPAEAEQNLELAVLSALAHNQEEEDVPVIMAALDALYRGSAQNEHLRYYVDLIHAAMGEAARSALKAKMIPAGYQYQSDFAQGYFSKGKQEGKQEGLQEGLRGLVKALLSVLASRGVKLTPAESTRITECENVELLTRWLTRAATASLSSSVFTD